MHFADPIVVLKRIFSMLSCVGSIIIMMTFVVAPKWQFEFKDAKQMLFVVSLYTTVACFGFFLSADPDSVNAQCKFQAAAIQWCGIGSALYDGLLAVESKLQIDAIFAGSPQRFDDLYFKPRHIIYHVVVALYGMITVIWMLSTDNVGIHYFEGAQSGRLCWMRRDYDLLLLALLPVWISLVAIIYCNISIIYNFWKTTKGGLVVKLSTRTMFMIYRLAAIPFFALLVWLPATILRITDAQDITLDGQQGLDYFWVCTFASSGFFNAIIYILMDGSVLQAWGAWLGELRHCSCVGKKQRASSFSGPASSYGAPVPSFMTSTENTKTGTGYSTALESTDVSSREMSMVSLAPRPSAVDVSVCDEVKDDVFDASLKAHGHKKKTTPANNKRDLAADLEAGGPQPQQSNSKMRDSTIAAGGGGGGFRDSFFGWRGGGGGVDMRDTTTMRESVIYISPDTPAPAPSRTNSSSNATVTFADQHKRPLNDASSASTSSSSSGSDNRTHNNNGDNTTASRQVSVGHSSANSSNRSSLVAWFGSMFGTTANNNNNNNNNNNVPGSVATTNPVHVNDTRSRNRGNVERVGVRPAQQGNTQSVPQTTGRGVGAGAATSAATAADDVGVSFSEVCS